MFTQYVFLVVLIVPVLSDFTIHQESYQRDCIDIACPKNAIKNVSHPLVKDDLKEAKCTICSQCTDYGFSVCAQARPSILRFKRDVDNYSCACANYVPNGCKIAQRSTAKRDPNTEVYSICYLSTLRTPPKPLALNQFKEVIATLEPFWLEPYWREFELSNLTLFFEFEVKSPELCDEIGNVTKNEGADPPYTCISSLQMEMTGEPISDGTDKSEYDPTDFFAQTDDIEYEDDEDDAPPEVEFARNVFADAKYVKLWYTVVVKRPRQLNLLKGEQKIHDVTTVLGSEVLKFDLQPEVYGDGNSPTVIGDDESGHNKINKVSIEDKNDEEFEEENDINIDDEDDALDEKDPIDDGTNDIEDKEEDEEIDDEEEENTEEDEEEEDDDDEGETEPTEETRTSNAIDETENNDEDDENYNENDKEDESENEILSTETTEEATTIDDEKENSLEDETEEEDKSINVLDDDIITGNDTSSFIETHFGNWPLVQVGMILALVACLLIIVAACCYKYRGCCCYSDRQKLVTKTSNGYEYHVTGQNGQEMNLITKKDESTKHVDENVLDATIRELQGIAESANIGEVQNSIQNGDTNKINEENQQLIEPENDNQEIQDFQELMRISPRLWPYRLRIDALVGNGYFGNIHKGLLIDSTRNTAQDAAVFSVKKIEQTNEKELRAIVNTFAETVKAGAHPNIISLLAVQQQPDRLLIVLDSLFYPDLLSMLRESRIIRYDSRLQKKTASMISSDILISMMLNCTYGCGHLIRHGITHPMLASANVLVIGRTLVKISGFGFANHRLLHQKQFESKPQKQRWLAPEYFTREYASPSCGQSNIWSLGVLLWEIASLGGTPYSEYSTQEAFQEKIREKEAQVENLNYCSDDLMSIIYQCCTYDRDSRPDMTDIIARKLEQISIDPESHIDITVKHDTFDYAPVISNLEQITAHL